MFRKKLWDTFKIWRKGHAVYLRNKKEICSREDGICRVDKITVCGASNFLGQNLALLLKLSDSVKLLSLFDDENVHGIAADLEHINTKCKVKGYTGSQTAEPAFRNADIVVVVDGWDKQLAGDEETCLKSNASILYDRAFKIANICPEAFVCLLTPPIDSLLPLFSETMKKCKTYDPRKIFGVCSLTETRANAVAGDFLGLDPASIRVPVVGGTSPWTSVPLFSRAVPFNEFSEEDAAELTRTVLEAPRECKRLHTAAPLSSAHAAAGFVLDLVSALCCRPCSSPVYRTAFVRSDALSGRADYFAGTLRIGRKGAELDCGLPKMTEFELEMVENAIPILRKNAEKGTAAYRRLIRSEIRKEAEKCVGKPFLTKTPVPDCDFPLPPEVCSDKRPESPCAPSETLLSDRMCCK